ncbi:MAG: FRG domain-containing protein [Treponema sp.]|nr:FRG domain-containing protein [Treponema sp.]
MNDYAFRGHADNSWKLKSTLERMCLELEKDITASWYKSVEAQTIIKYTNAVNIFNNNILANNIIEKLAFMQHLVSWRAVSHLPRLSPALVLVKAAPARPSRFPSIARCKASRPTAHPRR